MSVAAHLFHNTDTPEHEGPLMDHFSGGLFIANLQSSGVKNKGLLKYHLVPPLAPNLCTLLCLGVGVGGGGGQDIGIRLSVRPPITPLSERYLPNH